MPQKTKPPRLYLRKDEKPAVWIIRDRGTNLRTGCVEGDIEAAEIRLAEYLASKFVRDRSSRDPDQQKIGNVLIIYEQERGPVIAGRKELVYQLDALMPFWSERSISDIRGDTCRAYVEARGKVGGARRELETLRAAVRHYAKEYGLDGVPLFTMPPKGQPRDRWLTRQEAAALLRAARSGDRRQRRHLERFLLIGLYTGTRAGAILALQWHPNTVGGWIDLERGVLHRRGSGEAETKKRRPPMKIPPRLLAHLHRWRRQDGALRHVVHFNGGQIASIKKAFRGARNDAGLGQDVVPHILRHTRATWLAQAGVPVWEAAGSLGMTVAQFEKTYGHHHPDFQRQAAEAF